MTTPEAAYASDFTRVCWCGVTAHYAAGQRVDTFCDHPLAPQSEPFSHPVTTAFSAEGGPASGEHGAQTELPNGDFRADTADA